MRVLLMVLLLTTATQAHAFFDMFAKEKYLHCVFRDNALYLAISPRTLVLKDTKEELRKILRT